MKTPIFFAIAIALAIGIYQYVTVTEAERQFDILYLDARKAYLFEQDFEKAQRSLHQLVEARYPLAFYELGRMYERGEGVGMDRSQAQVLYGEGLPLLREAANRGDDVARLYLGEMYRFGRGVDPDPIRARGYFRDIRRTELVPVAERHVRQMAESSGRGQSRPE